MIYQALAENGEEQDQVLDQEVTAERKVLMVGALQMQARIGVFFLFWKKSSHGGGVANLQVGIGGDLVKVKEGSTKCVPGVPGEG